MVNLTSLDGGLGGLRPMRSLLGSKGGTPKEADSKVDNAKDSEVPAWRGSTKPEKPGRNAAPGRNDRRVSEESEAPPSIEVQYPLARKLGFWLVRNNTDDDAAPEALGNCSDVHEFWRYWNSIDITRLQPQGSLSVFEFPDRPRAGRKAPGGRWVIRPSEEKSAMEIFEEIVLTLVGNGFDSFAESGGAPKGVVYSVLDDSSAVVEVWNGAAADEVTEPVLAELRTLLGSNLPIEYTAHAERRMSTAGAK